MNIFRLHDDPELCAQYHTNAHCVKMLVEHCQIMSTAHHVAGSKLDLSTIYKKTHQNHPSGTWARESVDNYRWLYLLTCFLAHEYTHRYGRVHAVESSGLLSKLHKIPNLPDVGPTVQTQAMPERYRCLNPVVAYRNYYVKDKSHLFVWRNRDIPPWLVQFGFVQEDSFVRLKT
jgi:hypothetical protein